VLVIFLKFSMHVMCLNLVAHLCFIYISVLRSSYVNVRNGNITGAIECGV
jgi:hypothetical protein